MGEIHLQREADLTTNTLNASPDACYEDLNLHQPNERPSAPHGVAVHSGACATQFTVLLERRGPLHRLIRPLGEGLGLPPQPVPAASQPRGPVKR